MMEPLAFRSQLKARLIELMRRDLGPSNLDDVVAFQEARRKDKWLVRTADKKTRESRELCFPKAAARLRFDVSFEKVDGTWAITRYSLHFDRHGEWFRYDLDPDRARGLAHPLAHLHVNNDEPRFPTERIENPLGLLEFIEAQGLLDPPMSAGPADV